MPQQLRLPCRPCRRAQTVKKEGAVTGEHDFSTGGGGCVSSRAPWEVQLGKGQGLHPCEEGPSFLACPHGASGAPSHPPKAFSPCSKMGLSE